MPVVTDAAEFVKTLVESLGITSGGSPVEVVRRKTPSLPEGKSPPQIVISVGAEGPADYLDFEESEGISHPVAVTVVSAGGTREADDDTVRGWIQQIRRLVGKASTWAGFAGFLDVTRDGKVPFDRSALGKDFNYYTQVFTVRLQE